MNAKLRREKESYLTKCRFMGLVLVDNIVRGSGLKKLESDLQANPAGKDAYK